MLTISNIISFFNLVFGHVQFCLIFAVDAVRKLFIHVLTVMHLLEVIEEKSIKKRLTH